MIKVQRMPEVFCPSCVEQGGLEAYPYPGVPVLNCRLCPYFALGHWEGADAVFPDPHVVPEGLLGTGQVAR